MISKAIGAAAVGGIAMVWSYFTLKTFRVCKQIVLPPPPPPPEVRTENCYYCKKKFPHHKGSRKLRDRYNSSACESCAQIEDISTQLIAQSESQLKK